MSDQAISKDLLEKIRGLQATLLEHREAEVRHRVVATAADAQIQQIVAEAVIGAGAAVLTSKVCLACGRIGSQQEACACGAR